MRVISVTSDLFERVDGAGHTRTSIVPFPQKHYLQTSTSIEKVMLCGRDVTSITMMSEVSCSFPL